uniref:Uncharacterized protein n=1 Tax=Tanacetum cinerariifolium TaxID=118510 RepID=A0A699K1I6_TANCI|nr:hypothetical protein [Tanacetum cinerariifolium]
MAFISSAKNSREKGEVNTASIPTASTHISFASADVAATSISLDTILEKDWEKDYHTREPRSQDNGRREIYEQGSKEEEQAPKALMAIDGVGWDWSYLANEEENHALVADEEALTKFALMAKSSSSSKNENMAFISSAKNSSEKGEVNTASIPTASTYISFASADVAAASISLDTVCAYIASQSNGS